MVVVSSDSTCDQTVTVSLSIGCFFIRSLPSPLYNEAWPVDIESGSFREGTTIGCSLIGYVADNETLLDETSGRKSNNCAGGEKVVFADDRPMAKRRGNPRHFVTKGVGISRISQDAAGHWRLMSIGNFCVRMVGRFTHAAPD